MADPDSHDDPFECLDHDSGADLGWDDNYDADYDDEFGGSGDDLIDALERGPTVYDRCGSPVTPATVLEAYLQRHFPMADTRDGQLSWYCPTERAVVTWDKWKIPRSLAKTWKQQPYTLTHDTDFRAVVRACAAREETWIGHDIETLYCALHEHGLAHSVEARDADGTLVGGLYGLALGGVFCGESMFHCADKGNNASKLAVMYLVERLQAGGFTLLDCQQQNPHMQRFGAYELSDAAYKVIFDAGLEQSASF